MDKVFDMDIVVSFITLFIGISVILSMVYAIIYAIIKQTEENIWLRRILLFIFFLVCTFIYNARINSINDRNEEIQTYLHKIEKSADKIYGELANTNLTYKIENEILDINLNIEEIYSLLYAD